MKRTVKNIITIILMCLMCVSMLFTMNYAKNNITNSMNNGVPDMQGGNGGTPPVCQTMIMIIIILKQI